MRVRVRHFLHLRYAPFLCIAVAWVIALPSIAIGFYTDDYTLFASLARAFPYAPAWYDLYSFLPGDSESHSVLLERGFIAWWSAPELRVRLLRPLASVLVACEHAAFGDLPFYYHLHSLLWYGVLLRSLWALYRRLFSHDVAVLALLVFGLSSANLHLYGWLSARHMLLSVTFVVLGMLFAVRAEEEKKTAFFALHWLMLVLALLSGEAGVCGPVYLGVRAFFAHTEGRARSRAVFPYVGLALAYLAAYAALGGGARNSGMYLSPLSSPLAYARVAALRVPALLGNALLSVPADLLNVLPKAAIVSVGVLACGGFVWLLSRAWRGLENGERATLTWLGCAACVSLLAVVGGSPGSRMLALPNIGIAPLCATVFLRTPQGLPGAFARVSARALTRVFTVGTLLFSLPSLLGGVAIHSEMANKTDYVALHMPAGLTPTTRFVMIAASDPLAYMMPRALLGALGREQPACWSLLSGVHADHRVTRIAERSLRIEPMGGSFLEGEFERLYRAPDIAFQRGDEVTQCGVRIRVAALDGTSPIAIEAEFDVPLDDPSLFLARWQGEQFEKFEPPALGEEVVLPWYAGPTGLF